MDPSRDTNDPRKFRWRRIASALTRPASSIASRIALSVFGAALATGLAVTWTSSQSTDAFLRDKIDQKFAVILRSTAERLDLWYEQREIDLATFADSTTVKDSLRGLARNSANGRDELKGYLTYVLDQFPQYATLLVLAPDGHPLMEVGASLTLSDADRQLLARVEKARIEPLREYGARGVQIVSAQVKAANGKHLASLHAALRRSAVGAALTNDDLEVRGGIYVVDASGAVLFRSIAARARNTYERAFVDADAALGLADYKDASGERMVGASLAFPRFDWHLVIEEPYEAAFAPVVAIGRQLLGLNLAIILLFALIAYQMAHSLVRPILALSAGALRIADGEVGVVIEGRESGDEIGIMLRAFNTMAGRLRENSEELEQSRRELEDANTRLLAQNSELHRVNEVFQQLSITDDLTKLHNHRFFQDHLPREIKRSARTGEPLCLILADIDDFKALNDRYGHAVGDLVLRNVAEVMNRSVRDMDLLARYGGEEFVLLAARTDLDGATALAEKIRIAIENACFSEVDAEGAEDIQVTASFGVALYRGDDKAFFNDADRALYSAKANGKDCVMVAEEA